MTLMPIMKKKRRNRVKSNQIETIYLILKGGIVMNLKERIQAQKDKRAEKGSKPTGEQKQKPKIKKGKVMIPVYEGWSRFNPPQYPDLKGGFERFSHTFGRELSVLRELDFDGSKRSFEGTSAKLVETITNLFETGKIADIAKYPKSAKIPFLAWVILNDGDTTYSKKAEDEIMPDLVAMNVLFEKPEVKTREDPNLTGKTEGYKTSKGEPADEDEEEEDEEDEEEEEDK